MAAFPAPRAPASSSRSPRRRISRSSPGGGASSSTATSAWPMPLGGELRAQVMEAVTGMTEPTGWHVHHCQAQFIYVLKGWVTLEFEDGSKHRMEAGDSGLIPGEFKAQRDRHLGRRGDPRRLSIPGSMARRPASRRPAWGERSDGWSAPGREGLNWTARRSDDRSALGHEGLKRTALHPRRRAAAAAPDDPCRRGGTTNDTRSTRAAARRRGLRRAAAAGPRPGAADHPARHHLRHERALRRPVRAEFGPRGAPGDPGGRPAGPEGGNRHRRPPEQARRRPTSPGNGTTGGVDVILDVPTSSAALAVTGVAREKNKVFLNTGAATAELTGTQCSPNTVHWTYDTWMLAHGPPAARMVKAGGDTWFFITADYAFGHALQTRHRELRQGGGRQGARRRPLPLPGTTDFSSFLLQAQASRRQGDRPGQCRRRHGERDQAGRRVRHDPGAARSWRRC